MFKFSGLTKQKSESIAFNNQQLRISGWGVGCWGGNNVEILLCQFSIKYVPLGIWCQNDVVSTSMRRNHVELMLIRRHVTPRVRWDNTSTLVWPPLRRHHRRALVSGSHLPHRRISLDITSFYHYHQCRSFTMWYTCTPYSSLRICVWVHPVSHSPTPLLPLLALPPHTHPQLIFHAGHKLLKFYKGHTGII